MLVPPGLDSATLVIDYLLTKEIATGLKPEEALIEKAQEKGRRYGTLQNVSGTPALPSAGTAAAQAYRRGIRWWLIDNAHDGPQGAAQFLRVHPEELRRRAKAGQIPGAKVGRAWVFLAEDLAGFLRSLYVHGGKRCK